MSECARVTCPPGPCQMSSAQGSRNDAHAGSTMSGASGSGTID